MTVIRVGARPRPFEERGLFLDGLRAEPVQVRLTIDEDARHLVITGVGVSESWPLDDIREVPDQAGSDLMVLRLRNDMLKRVLLDNRDLVPRLRNRTRSAPVTRRGRLLAWAAAAVASVALIITVLVPTMADQLADYIPPEGERALGDVTLTQIREALDETGLSPIPFCEDGRGLAALDKMTARLVSAMDEPAEVSVFVLNHPMVNAFALPGGHVVFFKGLIDAAETPEEVAAVLAHEIGHVISRDPTRHALRSAGSIGVLGLLFGDFAGGAVVLFLTERLIDATYSRGAEAAADGFAHELMLRAKLPPDALASMFETFRRMGGDAEGIVRHFLSHPALGDRIERARLATPDGFVPEPLLTDAEWRALRTICR